MTLRERLLALAVDANATDATGEYLTRERLAIAAARLALEDAAKVCDDRAIVCDGLESDASTRYFADTMRGAKKEADTCAAAIRSRAREIDHG